MGKNSQDSKLLRHFSAGGVVYKRVKEQESRGVKVLWLVTKSMPSKLFPRDIWRLPKGWIDDSKSGPGPIASGKRRASEDELQKAALREVKEEAGVIGKAVSKIGTTDVFFNFKNQKILKFITFYLMEWTKNAPEGFDSETEKIEWLSYEDAEKRLDLPHEIEVLKKAKEILGSKT